VNHGFIMYSGNSNGFRLARRCFLRGATATVGLAACPWFLIKAAHKNAPPLENPDAIRQLIERNRPGRMAVMPPQFCARVGATHVAGKYHLTSKPFLLEGAEKLLDLGTKLGKFWLIPKTIKSSYPFNSQWPECRSLLELVRTPYFEKLLGMPFETLFFEAHAPIEESWRRPSLKPDFYENVTKEFFDLTAHLYQTLRNRQVTVVLQHWEGDWMLRGRGGEMWTQPPDDWPQLCERMVKWLAARQAGVSQARARYGSGARCRVAHATEVNRVTDIWKNIPTVTQHVLPKVELDLISYSSYDGLGDPLTMWQCIQEIKKFARTGPLFGPKAVCIGEIGIPENVQPNRIVERWDEMMGVFLASDMLYIIHWELYCNEFKGNQNPPPKTPVTDPNLLRGFWLIKPDGSLSESGRYFHALWKKARGG